MNNLLSGYPLWLLWIALSSAGVSDMASGASVVQERDVDIDPTYSCIVCHRDKRRSFRLGVHSERGIRCHDCHGGDPSAFERASAHGGPAYLGAPGKIETVELCASCHADPDLMRQYGLPAGQLAEYRTSRHGQLLLEERNTDAPTCTDCHDAHTILPPNDARSNVHPTAIAETCARCHEDAELMAEYGLPTDQVRTHRKSAHGMALYDQHNFSAPTCVGCHGSHAALPPAVTEIANVCGRCHVLVRRAFSDGPHGAATRTKQLPGCTACHSNHGTERVPPDSIAASCTGCHASGGTPVLVGIEIQEDAIHATEELRLAAEAIDELVRAGRQVTNTRVRYRTALTAYRQISQSQHRLELETLSDLTREVSSISRDIRGSAEVSSEHRWEHKLLLIPVWFLALSAVVLSLFKLRAIRNRETS